MFVPKVCLKRKKCYCYGDEDVSFNSSSLFNLLSDKSFSFSRKIRYFFRRLIYVCSVQAKEKIKDLFIQKFIEKYFNKEKYIIPLKLYTVHNKINLLFSYSFEPYKLEYA